ncbi:Variable large protein 18 (plasmid) [Borrelia turicatae]|uniref:Variable large protein n=1 Tax=Borrelia turicatae TaxID=142 RepID=A0A172XD15_BORTU|nr:variable large family protein [Borrelia turicatae]ANF34531.1 Variable large protein 18 [Borrelia turicatae]UPA15652.1 variable large family protein [Borrelia turicatae]
MKHKLSERIKNFNITILISLFLLFSCGSGQQPQAGKDGAAATGGRSLSEVLMEVGRSAENVFYSFIELVSDTLGFTVTKDTKKSDVGDYFSSLGAKLEAAANDLEQVAVKSNTDVDKDGLLDKAIKEAVDSAKTTLSTLKGHLESLGQVGDGNVVGDANVAAGSGTTVNEESLKKSLNALQGIVKTATDIGVKALEAGGATLKVNEVDNKDGAKILATSGANPGVQDSGKASAILAIVSGEEMLDSIVKSKDSDVALAAAAGVNTTAVSFAKGGSSDNLSNADTPKAAAVAGGIALRSLINAGKLASGAAAGNAGGKEEVQGVGITAVNKLLGALEDIIKKTVKNVLKTAKEKIDKARDPKAAGNE